MQLMDYDDALTIIQFQQEGVTVPPLVMYRAQVSINTRNYRLYAKNGFVKESKGRYIKQMDLFQKDTSNAKNAQ